MKPWISGSKELLTHAVEHMNNGSAFDNRIAFISIDNAIELMIKTFLGLPKRIRKSNGPSRRKLDDASNSFPDLLDLLEEHFTELIEEINLEDIEWYHRLRNTLYHDGNGITVDKEKVDSYLQISIILFNILFTEEFNKDIEFEPQSILGEIVLRFSQLEEKIKQLYINHFPEKNMRTIQLSKAIQELYKKGVISKELLSQFDDVFIIRNQSVHNSGKFDKSAVIKATDSILDISAKIQSLYN